MKIGDDIKMLEWWMCKSVKEELEGEKKGMVEGRI